MRAFGALILAVAIPQDASEPLVTVRCSAVPAVAHPRIRLEGKGAFPDATVIRIALFALEERWSDGRLAPIRELVGGGFKAVQRRTFAWELKDDTLGPGRYQAVVELHDEDQKARGAPGLPGMDAPRRWTFDLDAWGDDLAGQLGPRLAEVETFAGDAWKLVERFAASAGSREIWKKEFARGLDKEATALLAKLRLSPARRLYPVSAQKILLTVRELTQAAAVFAFADDGAFAGTSNDPKRGKNLSLRPEGFAFEHLKKDLEEALRLAGRELRLWVIKDLRRGGPRDPLLRALRDQERGSGTREFLERLEKATREDFDLVEQELRARQ